MGSSAVYELAILLSLKDAASRGLDRFEDRLRATGKEGKELLQTVQDLRKDISQGLGQGGVGITTLAMLKKGVGAAAEYEQAVLDLRSAYQESSAAGSLSLGTQAAQLNKLETLAVQLGNRLQGTTQDYVGILTSLKKSCVETEDVLNGAGEAASNLANVTGAVTKGMADEQAKELGQFGKLFKLEGKDFLPSVDLFSALKDRFDIGSSELIESAKYFKTTAATLGMTGLPGATETSKFFALVKRYGALEGSQAGTSATSFFQQFTVHADKLAKLKKEKGIDVQLFDAKGSFKGWENAFKEMEKFRQLTGQKRLEALNEIFGEQGGKVAGVMVEAGAEGWANVAAEAKKAVSVNEKINQQMETYNAKWESLTGTLTNLKATVFSPMLDVLKPILDISNSVLGEFQGWAKTHPEIAKLVTTTAGMIGILLTITGGIRAASAAWGLYKIASAAALGGAEAKVKGLASRLTSLPTTIKLGLVLGAAWYTAERIMEWLEARKAAEVAESQLNVAGQDSITSLTKLKEAYAKEGKPVPQEIWDTRGKTALRSIDLEGTLVQSLKGGMGQWFKTVFQNPFAAEKYPFYSLNTTAQSNLIKKRAPELEIPEMMAALRKQLRANLLPEERAPFEQVLGKAFPESFQKSSDILVKSLTDITPPLNDTSEGLSKMVKPANELPGALQRSVLAADNFTNQLNGLKFGPDSFNFPTIPGGTPPPAQPPSLTPQWDVVPLPRRSPLRISSNTFAPSSGITRALGTTAALSRGSGASNVHFGDILIKVPEGSPAANNPKELARFIRQELQAELGKSFDSHLWNNQREIERIVESRLSRGEESA